MRSFFYISAFMLCLSKGFSQTFEFVPNSKDTVNYCTSKGERKGKWMIFGRHSPNPCYTPFQLAETGMYEKNMKQGLWKEFHCTGQLKSEQHYVNGKVNGEVTLYHENGKKKAQGTFKIDHWVNDLQLFDESGKLLYNVHFDAMGNRMYAVYLKLNRNNRSDSVLYYFGAPSK